MCCGLERHISFQQFALLPTNYIDKPSATLQKRIRYEQAWKAKGVSLSENSKKKKKKKSKELKS
jgi:hypothetical protein